MYKSPRSAVYRGFWFVRTAVVNSLRLLASSHPPPSKREDKSQPYATVSALLRREDKSQRKATFSALLRREDKSQRKATFSAPS